MAAKITIKTLGSKGAMDKKHCKPLQNYLAVTILFFQVYFPRLIQDYAIPIHSSKTILPPSGRCLSPVAEVFKVEFFKDPLKRGYVSLCYFAGFVAFTK